MSSGAVLKSVYRLAGISALIFTVSLCLPAIPQDQPERRRRFEVASVKPSDPKTPRPFISNSPSRFVATNVPLVLYIGTAYGVDAAFIKGFPESMADDKYDIAANATDPDDHRPAGAMRHWRKCKCYLRSVQASGSPGDEGCANPQVAARQRRITTSEVGKAPFVRTACHLNTWETNIRWNFNGESSAATLPLDEYRIGRR
jgi:hypothetical protein